MLRWMRLLQAALVGGVLVGVMLPATAQDKPKKEKLSLQAQRAGWMLGMYVGEGKGSPYPFITQVDPKSDAKLKGVRPGDELIRFQDEEIHSLPRLFKDVNELRPGREVSLWVRRGVQTLNFKLRVPREAGAAPVEKEAAKAKDPKETEGEGTPEEKKKPKKKPPVVIKPVPTGKEP